MISYSDTYGGYDGGQAEYLRVPFANVGSTIAPDILGDEILTKRLMIALKSF